MATPTFSGVRNLIIIFLFAVMTVIFDFKMAAILCIYYCINISETKPCRNKILVAKCMFLGTRNSIMTPLGCFCGHTFMNIVCAQSKVIIKTSMKTKQLSSALCIDLHININIHSDIIIQFDFTMHINNPQDEHNF